MWYVYSHDFPNIFREVFSGPTYYSCRKWIKNRARQGLYTASFVISSLLYEKAKQRYYRG